MVGKKYDTNSYSLVHQQICDSDTVLHTWIHQLFVSHSPKPLVNNTEKYNSNCILSEIKK